MNITCICCQDDTRLHAFALQVALSASGLPALIIVEERMPQGANSPIQYAVNHSCSSLVMINPRLKDLRVVEGVVMAALYTTRYARALSVDVMAWHERNTTKALWERIPSRVSSNPWARTILLPPTPTSVSYANVFEKSRGLKPHIASLRPPLEPEEARALQQDYLSKMRRRTELILFTAHDSMDHLHRKVAATELWFLPSIPGGHSLWSLEMSTVLAQGGRVAATAPPPGIGDLVFMAANYDEAEDIAMSGDAKSHSSDVVGQRLIKSCQEALAEAQIIV